MRGDHLIILLALSIASVITMIYGSLMTPHEVYITNTLRRSDPDILNVRILSTDRTNTFNIEGRKKQPINYFTDTYNSVKRIFPHVETIVDYKTELYKNVSTLRVINPIKNRKIRLHALKMYMHALNKNNKPLLLLEDDVKIHPSIKEKITWAIKQFKKRNIDNYILDCSNIKNGGSTPFIEDLHKVKYLYGTVCMVYSESAANMVYNTLKKQQKVKTYYGYDHSIKTLHIPTYAFTSPLVKHMGRKSTGLAGAPFEENTKFNHSIMIAIPTYNRIGYTKFHAKIMREYHKIPSYSLYIFDDCSTEYGEKELREWYGKDIHFFPCTKRLKSDANIRRMFEYFITTDFDLIFSVDTDLIFHKNWREFILKHIDSTDGVMSLYHSNAPHHKTFNCKGGLCEKRSMGSAGTVMKKGVVKQMLRQHKSNIFDWGFVSIFKQRKIRMMIPNKSLIMHYGQIGQNNGCGSSEIARGFDRTILPKWIKDRLSFYFDKCNNPSLVYNDAKIVLNGIKLRKKYNVKTSDVIKYNTNGIPKYKTCAIVGSGPSLLDRLDGEEINSHDGVFRFNGALTSNYEKHVGTKTTIRISYGVNCATNCCPDGVLTNILCADNLYPHMLNTVEKILMVELGNEKLHMPYPHWQTNYPRLTGMKHPKETTFMKFSNVNLFKYFRGSHLAHAASSGLKGILLGVTMCDSVTLYGFDLGKIQNKHIKNTRLHYYDNWYLKRKNGHNFHEELKFIKTLF